MLGTAQEPFVCLSTALRHSLCCTHEWDKVALFPLATNCELCMSCTHKLCGTTALLVTEDSFPQGTEIEAQVVPHYTTNM